MSCKKGFTLRELLIVIAIMGGLALALYLYLLNVRANADFRIHKTNISRYGTAFRQYASDYGAYPDPHTWCDLLMKHANIKRELTSYWAGDSFYHTITDSNDKLNLPTGSVLVDEHNEPGRGKSYKYLVPWCHFALNKSAEPNSSPDTVLLFSTKRGWNQFGGPDILTTENYKEKNLNGSYVLFNDGSVKFIKISQIKNLKWK